MNSALLLLLLPLSVLAQDSKIIKGTDVDIKDFPWQGSYRSLLASHSCGCVFMGGRWVITAGHCGGNRLSSMEFGSSRRGQGVVFKVDKVTRHPDYGVGAGFTPNDFAIVRAGSVISGAGVSPGRLPADGGNPGGQAWITGWGKTCNFCAPARSLQGAQLNVLADADCSQRIGPEFNGDVMICVHNGRQSACNGDSGGPMSSGSTILGLTSWGTVGCRPSQPQVYSKVGAARDWFCRQSAGQVNGC